jgi:hypothetical protein
MAAMNRPLRATLAAFAALGAVFALLALQWRGPAPKPIDAPPTAFSAIRAFEVLRATIGTAPHPSGSTANRAVRDRIVARLSDLGYEAQVRHVFACNSHSVCGWTDNIVAHPPGQPGGPMVMMTAHYDSVPAGPGASDDGSGVAALLEIARAVRTEHFRNPIMFLLDDGEEGGLLGAEAFLQTPASRFASVVINLEARGTNGPSSLFETSNRNRWFLPIVVHALPHPATSSLFYTIYQRLPNDTDLTVFKRAGLTGVNFAFIGNVDYYHTPLDDTAHVNLRTLQSQGDNTLAALRALGNTELGRQSDDDAVWFDVLGLFVIWWPARWTFFFALLSLGTAIVAAAVLVRDKESTVDEIASGIFAVIPAVAIAAIAGYALSLLSSARSHGPWLAFPGAALTAAWIAGIIATLAIGGAFRRRARSGALFAGIAIAWNIAAICVSVPLAGVSHLLLVPAIALSIASLLRATAIDTDVVPEIACAVVAAVLWFPLLTEIYVAIGRPSLVLISAGAAVVATTFAPLFATRTQTVISGVSAALILALVSSLLPPVTAQRPQKVSLAYVDDGATSRWVASTATPKMRAAARFERSDKALFPWSLRSSPLVAPAPRLNVPAVSVSTTSESGQAKRTVTLRVVTARNANSVALFFRSPATIDRVRINGVVPPSSEPANRLLEPGWHMAAVRGGGAMDVEITTRGHLPLDVIATDTTFGLPPEGQAVADARNQSNAVPSDQGDTTVTMRRARF